MHIRYSADMKKIAAGQEDGMIMDDVEISLNLRVLELYKICLSWNTNKAKVGGRNRRILQVAYPHTCTHWLLLSAINIFPFVDAATP